jgi:hypothetical protein
MLVIDKLRKTNEGASHALAVAKRNAAEGPFAAQPGDRPFT